MKKAIAMKCTQEQWDSIKDKITLPITDDEFDLKRYPWLTNTYDNKTGIGTCLAANNFSNREIHEKFNAKIFLDACGIETDAYKITKDQVLELFKMNCVIKEKFCDLFPDAFKKDLEAGKWMKTPSGGLYCPKEKQGNGFICYGFTPTSKTYKEVFVSLDITKDDVEATPQEVEAALISEAIKRGFEDGATYHPISQIGELKHNRYRCNGQFVYNKTKNCLHAGFQYIFDNGQWATIIQPEKMTLEQIEKELGRKIELI